MSSFQNSIHMVAGKYPSPDLTHLVIVLSHPVNEVITVITETVAAATETLSETSDPDSPGGDEIQFVSSEEECSLLGEVEEFADCGQQGWNRKIRIYFDI